MEKKSGRSSQSATTEKMLGEAGLPPESVVQNLETDFGFEMNEVESSSTEVPPPPPPPIFLLSQQEPKLSPQSLISHTKVDENRLELAVNKLLSSEGSFKHVFYKCNTSVMPQLQDGPKCGLVALSIATSRAQDFVKVDDIFQTALSQGLTKQGEMFSAESLAWLAETCCGFKTRVLHGGLHSHIGCIIGNLLRKCFLLVPYDADFNHAPCCKRGMKAHWTVITGFVIVKQENSKNKNQSKIIKINANCSVQCNCPNTNTSVPLTISSQDGALIIGKESTEKPQEDMQEGKIYLIGLQGKSQHIGLWPFNDMADSNDNLSLFSTSRDSDFYVLPEGGVEEGLKGKAIILDSNHC